MFIVNGEILSKTKTPELYKWYDEKISTIKSLEKDTFIFSAHKRPHYETDDSGRKRLIRQFKALPSSSTIWNEEMKEHQTWIFAPSVNSITNLDGISVVKNKRPIVIGGTTLFSKKHDIDIIFFLRYISEGVKNGKAFEVDIENDNIEEAKKNKMAAKAQYLLYDDDSPIHPNNFGSEKAIRDLGIAWGVVDAMKIHVDEVRNKLWEKILKAEKTRDFSRRGFSAFIDKVNDTKEAAKRALILRAINLGVLTYEDGSWSLQAENTTTNICSVSPQMEGEKEEVVIGYILENIHYLSLVEKSVETASEKQKEKPKQAKTDTVSFDRIKAIDQCIEELGWKKGDLWKKKNEEIENILKNQIKPVGSE